MESVINDKEIKQYIEERNGYAGEANEKNIDLLFSVLDYTSLNSVDNSRSVRNFVQNAINLSKDHNLPHVASVCVYSNFTEEVREQVKNTGIKAAVVAGSFPHGQSPLDARANEVRLASACGADEIDVVINRGLLLLGEYQELAIELYTLRQMAGDAKLKFILEVCDLNLTQVYKASIMAMQAGADFIKTSTGKGAHGATLEASLVMCRAISHFYQKTGTAVGFKASGGIRTVSEAVKYMNLVKDILGEEWLTPDRFRIGASSLASDIVAQKLSMKN